MSFYVEKTNTFENCPAGVHLARCYRIVDLGTQRSQYAGQVKFLHKIMVSWEVHVIDEDTGQPVLTKKSEPFGIFKNYNLSWDERASLRLDLQSWRGKPFTQEEMRRFDLKNVLGAYCMINVIHKSGESGDVFANVSDIMPVPSLVKQKGLPAPHNANTIFTLQEPDFDLLATFSESLQNKIKSSPEYQKLQSAPKAKPPVEEEDDSIPF